MQCTYCLISQELKAVRNLNLVSEQNITWGTFSLKNHSQNVVQKLFPDPFLRNQIWEYFWINSLMFYVVCFYCMPSSSINLPNFIIWLSLLREILDNMFIWIVCEPGCHVISFETNLSFLHDQRIKTKILENKETF